MILSVRNAGDGFVSGGEEWRIRSYLASASASGTAAFLVKFHAWLLRRVRLVEITWVERCH